MVRVLRIPAEADHPITELQVNKLEDYQAAVGGGVEAVDVPALGKTIFVHEEGLLLDQPLNSRTTFLWWYFVPGARQRAMLVGPALIVGLPDRIGDSTDIPSNVADLLTQAGTWRVEVRVVGEVTWYRHLATYDDYWEALVWAMVTLERWSAAEDVRVVPASQGTVRIVPIRPEDIHGLGSSPVV